MRRPVTVEVPWSSGDGDYLVTCRVGEDDPGQIYGPPERCYPPEAGEVEIVAVREDAPGHALRPDLLDAAEEDFDRIAEAAYEARDEAARDYY